MDLGLQGKVALVTGGSRGIGRSIALGFAEAGANVGICGRNAENLDAVAAEIGGRGVKCSAIIADLRTAEECRRVVDDVATSLGRLDILVNNAATNVDAPSRRLEEVSDDELLERFEGKALPAIRCSRAALPYLQASPAGRIIFIGGISARTTAMPTGLPTSMSGASIVSGIGNAAIANFAKNLGNQVIKDGILVNVVHPGNTKTDRYGGRLTAKAVELGVTVDEADKFMARATPLGRLVEPEDVAHCVVFLASRLASAIAGQAIAIDGGETSTILY